MLEPALTHYLCFRPHQRLRGATPAEAFLGLPPGHATAVSPPPRTPPRGATRRTLRHRLPGSQGASVPVPQDRVGASVPLVPSRHDTALSAEPSAQVRSISVRTFAASPLLPKLDSKNHLSDPPRAPSSRPSSPIASLPRAWRARAGRRRGAAAFEAGLTRRDSRGAGRVQTATRLPGSLRAADVHHEDTIAGLLQAPDVVAKPAVAAVEVVFFGRPATSTMPYVRTAWLKTTRGSSLARPPRV